MKNIWFLVLPLGFILFSVCGFTPSNAENELFSIGRNKDPDEIIYSLNLENSHQLNSEEPIRVFWLKKTKQNKMEPLTWVQQNFSYGIKYLEHSSKGAKFHFAGYSKRIFILRKNNKGEFKVFTTSNHQEVEVSRIYIYITGGTFWIPEIPKVELHTYREGTKSPLLETIKP